MGITLAKCAIKDANTVLLPSISWKLADTERWLITGPNGSGKSTLAAAIAGQFEIEPENQGLYANTYGKSVALVSLEEAARLIEEEKRRDDSDFVEGGIDPGRTVRFLIAEGISPEDQSFYPDGLELENHPAVLRFGVGPILDRGIKYLSTGEIRRTLLAKALASKPKLLILDEPFDGLDQESRIALNDALADTSSMSAILIMDRLEAMPPSITHVLELTNRRIAFSGSVAEYQIQQDVGDEQILFRERLDAHFSEAQTQRENILPETARTDAQTLVEMRNVTVEWSGRLVLDNLTWTLRRGEHWLIRGPNGSGKTTFLELITGDNPQVFRNDVRLFGSRRGSGETIWEIKEKLGIVSYRLHTEYRALGGLSLKAVILSGLHDSIGLYLRCGEEELELAEKWLSLAGFSGRGDGLFRDLSYGEQRLILIARAAIKQPPILILDEPCHGLDAPSRELALTLLAKIADEGGSTLLHVTHDPTERLECERRVLELCPGKNPMYQLT